MFAHAAAPKIGGRIPGPRAVDARLRTRLEGWKEADIAGLGWIRRLYEWVAGFADSRHAGWILFVIAFAESSFFPIPPDVLLIALAFAAPRRSFRYALICTAGSVLGGAFGYWLGAVVLRDAVVSIVETVGLSHGFAQASVLYQEYDVMVVGAAAFTVIPYKVFTILAGLFDLDFPRFVLASVIGRGGRFFLVAACIFFLGPRVKPFVEKYLELLALALAALVVVGFLSIKWLQPEPPPTTPEELAARIVALEDPDVEVRKEAIKFLLRRTEAFFAFHPRGSEEDRAKAAGLWREWFAAEHPGVPIAPGEERGDAEGERVEEAPPLSPEDRTPAGGTPKMGEE